MDVHTSTLTCTRTYTYTHICICIHTCAHARTHTHDIHCTDHTFNSYIYTLFYNAVPGFHASMTVFHRKTVSSLFQQLELLMHDPTSNSSSICWQTSGIRID